MQALLRKGVKHLCSISFFSEQIHYNGTDIGSARGYGVTSYLEAIGTLGFRLATS